MQTTNWSLLIAAVAVAGTIAAAPAVATGRPTGLVIVGLKHPATPPIVRELRRELTIVRVAPGGVSLLVKPRKGQTIEKIEKIHPRIAYAEAEVTMSVEPR